MPLLYFYSSLCICPIVVVIDLVCLPQNKGNCHILSSFSLTKVNWTQSYVLDCARSRVVRLSWTRSWSSPGSTESTDHWGSFRARASSFSFVSLAIAVLGPRWALSKWTVNAWSWHCRFCYLISKKRNSKKALGKVTHQWGLHQQCFSGISLLSFRTVGLGPRA